MHYIYMLTVVAMLLGYNFNLKTICVRWVLDVRVHSRLLHLMNDFDSDREYNYQTKVHAPMCVSNRL